MSAKSFKKLYQDELVPQLKKAFNYTNVMCLPRLEKITLNMGLGPEAVDKKVLDAAVSELTRIAGQKAVITYARKSIAGFKIREGWPLGCKVTLRSDAMFRFLERLIMVSLPKVRDFRGLNKRSFDGRGNYTLGISEQIIFPEIDYDKVDKLRGMDITFVTSAKTNEEAMALLKGFHFPFPIEKGA